MRRIGLASTWEQLLAGSGSTLSPYAPFSVEVEPAEWGVVAVVVGGEIDMASSPEFEAALTRAVRDRDARALIVDLTAVTFIDSSGVSSLVRALEKQRFAGGALAIVSNDSRVSTIFEISRLDRVLRLFPSRDAAVTALSGAAQTG
jgi:anti-sigma B factor antagonist